MLTRDENELLCRVGPDTPMGQMLRRYWIPAFPSEKLEAGGAPRRVRLLGEDLIVFRDHSGAVGVLDEYCPHRGASLVLARNEGCALTCIYHGWRIDAAGTVLETPAEPEASDFGSRIKHISYPVREVGGLVWAYLGPPALAPAFPAFGWTTSPDSHRLIITMVQDCNWVQALEGVIDSAHSNYLHSDEIRPQVPRETSTNTMFVGDRGSTVLSRPSNDGRPRLEAQDTAYGFRYAAIRRPLVAPERDKYVRTTLFIAPFHVLIPPPAGWAYYQAFVPIDDEHTMLFYVQCSADALVDKARLLEIAGARPGIDLDDDFRKTRSRSNNWLQDRQLMKSGSSFSGIYGLQNQDMAVQESMGPLYDRTREHLGTSDVAVIRFRRLMLDSVQAMQAGAPPLGLAEALPYERLRAEERVIPHEVPWQTVGAFAGELAEADQVDSAI